MVKKLLVSFVVSFIAFIFILSFFFGVGYVFSLVPEHMIPMLIAGSLFFGMWFIIFLLIRS